MRTRSLSLTRLFPLVCVAALSVGCSDDTTATDDASETTAMSGSETQSNPETTGSAMDTSTTDEPTTTTDSNDENTFIADEGPDTGVDTGGMGNLGDQCMADGDCAEDLFCNGVAGFGGICSECASDSDCAEGNCTFLGSYFGCGEGELGQQCESDEVCGEGLFCAEVVNLGGLLNGDFCSECEDDSGCTDGQLCAPQIDFVDLMNFSGQRSCIDPGTAPDGQVCDVNANGDDQCENFCTEADIMGLITVGLCGACETDGDCEQGQTCVPAMIGFDGFAGSVCM